MFKNLKGPETSENSPAWKTVRSLDLLKKTSFVCGVPVKDSK